MNAGATGGAMIFFSLLAMEIIVSLCVLAYTAHSLLVVLEHTAAGNDEVLWPDEPYVDWAWKLAYVGWVVAMCVVPTSLLLKLFPLTTVQFYGLLAAIALLLLPILLLSSLGASSRWVLFHPVIFGRLLRRLDALVVLYVVSGLLVAASAVAVYGAFQSGLIWLVAGMVLAAAVLIYGRLLGRVAWMINQGGSARQEPRPSAGGPNVPVDTWDDSVRKARTPPKWSAASWDEEPPPVRKNRTNPRRKSRPEASPLSGEEVFPVKHERYFTREIYKTKDYEPPPPKAAAEQTGEPGYAVVPTVGESAAEKKRRDEAALPEVSQYELELAGMRDENPPPAWPLFTGVYGFPWYPSSLVPFVWLAGGYLAMGLILIEMLASKPS